ncbi:hypothetical protein JKP88DRAFT_223213, partial [Tribonema minus]
MATPQRKIIWKVMAAAFVTGAGMELFMIKTGFYDVATRKEAERVSAALGEAALKDLNKERQERRARVKKEMEEEVQRRRRQKGLVDAD